MFSRGISGDLGYHPASVGPFCSEWTKRQEQSCSKKVCPGSVDTDAPGIPDVHLRAMLEYCSASHDLRLLLCHDFKDYPRRGKFTQATRLEKLNVKGSFRTLWNKFGSGKYRRISCMATSCAAWMLRNPFFASHIAEHFSLSTQPRSHTWV